MALTGLADLAGRVLADRYRLLAPIGTGGSGRVYVADDVRLRRRVAVKVLHGALSDDAGFLRRFRAEAQHAASLHHPNITTVYDWGEDAVPFMVLELLSGGSLRGMLDDGIRLSPAQAAYVGRQVAAALSYAHSRGLVHRDIKPANLLFDEHGTVRVADFGLARALAEASWTEPTGALVGTARYAAPEQATGATLDGRADLYALGIVLVESVTGHIPDLADTLIGTLAVRARTPLVAPEELGALAPVVERAGRPRPSERYPDATTMADALTDASRHLPPPGPLTLVGLDAHVDPHPTELGARHGQAVFDQDADTVATTSAAPDAAALAEEKPAPRPGRYAPRAVPAVVAALAIAVLVAAGLLIARSAGGGTVTAPQLVGLTQQDAAARADEAGLVVKVEQREVDDPAGRVISQSPAAGTFLDDGGTVRLVVSRGPPPVAIPDVAGQHEQQAALVLNGAGFAVDTQHDYDENVPAGIAIRTDPAANEKRAPESTLALVVSDGPRPVTVPDASGKSYDATVSALQAKRFTATRLDDFSDSVPAGTVIGTDPPAGQLAPRDSQVVVHVSKGPQPVAVPNVVGASVEQASQALQASGLVADVQNFAPGRTVKSQTPPAGTQVNRGTKVTLAL
ncbi:MAG TPA: PASTA domain-containing protein [Acidimicrobiia bacterium]|nr:PASTA domain-containing protein [Acidimicrobiia bacterium]